MQSEEAALYFNVLGLVKLQGWLQARRTANPQFLKLKGAQQPGNSYKSMGTKLHPPHSNRTCQKQFRIQMTSMLEVRGPVRTLGIGRFRCLHSLLMRAIRCANSEHSALNAGVPTDPHSPESNSLYLAQIWSIKELYSLCASCTVIK